MDKLIHLQICDVFVPLYNTKIGNKCENFSDACSSNFGTVIHRRMSVTVWRLHYTRVGQFVTFSTKHCTAPNGCVATS